ncbi:MAG: hypothetical protein WC682_04910 [Parcubacteria group bacterium]|jgi:hypothetical protein
MKLFVNGKSRRICSDVVKVLTIQFDELVKLLKGKNEVFKWLNGLDGNHLTVRVLLKNAGLKTLSSDIGIAFLKSKFPCPAGINSH